MSIVQFASDGEIDSQIQALNNAVDGLSLVIAQQRQVMRQALDALVAGDWYINWLEMIVYSSDDTGTHENRAIVQSAVLALRNSLEGKQ